jgi:hypothetical protein
MLVPAGPGMMMPNMPNNMPPRGPPSVPSVPAPKNAGSGHFQALLSKAGIQPRAAAPLSSASQQSQGLTGGLTGGLVKGNSTLPPPPAHPQQQPQQPMGGGGAPPLPAGPQPPFPGAEGAGDGKKEKKVPRSLVPSQARS